MIRKARLFLAPAALALLITSQWPDIRRYLKIRQLSQGNGQPPNVPLKGTTAYPQRPGDGEQDGTETSIRPAGRAGEDFHSASREGRRKDRSKIAAITRSWNMIILGIILLIIGFIAHIAIVWTIGIIVLVAGAILALLGMMGHAVGGRRHYF